MINSFLAWILVTSVTANPESESCVYDSPTEPDKSNLGDRLHIKTKEVVRLKIFIADSLMWLLYQFYDMHGQGY